MKNLSVMFVVGATLCLCYGIITPQIEHQKSYEAKERFPCLFEEPETWCETRLYTNPYYPPTTGLRVQAVPNKTLVSMNFYQFLHSYFIRTQEAYEFDPFGPVHPPFLAEDVFCEDFQAGPVAQFCLEYLKVPPTQEECFYCAQWDVILINTQMEELIFDGTQWVSLAGNGGTGTPGEELYTYGVSEYTYIIPTRRFDSEQHLIRSDAWMRSCVFNATKTTDYPTINRITCIAMRYKVMPIRMVCDVYVY